MFASVEALRAAHAADAGDMIGAVMLMETATEVYALAVEGVR